MFLTATATAFDCINSLCDFFSNILSISIQISTELLSKIFHLLDNVRILRWSKRFKIFPLHDHTNVLVQLIWRIIAVNCPPLNPLTPSTSLTSPLHPTVAMNEVAAFAIVWKTKILFHYTSVRKQPGCICM